MKIKLKVMLMRSPSVGQEEDKVLGLYDSVQITYDILRVDDKHIGVYDHEDGVWRLNIDDTVWSDIYVKPTVEE